MGDEARENAQRRLERVREVYDGHGLILHIVWVAAAIVVIGAGLAMTVLPGPAMVVLPLGLAMLAVVFGWARRLLLVGVEEGADVARAWRHASTWMKVSTAATVAAVVGGIAAWVIL